MNERMLWKVTFEDGRTEKGSVLLGHGTARAVCSGENGTVTRAVAKVHLPVPASARVFMNGFQSWTWCPDYGTGDRIRGLQGLPHSGIRHFSLDRYSDYHFQDYPYLPGILQGYTYCTFAAPDGKKLLLIGSVDEENGYTFFRYHADRQTLYLSKDAKGLDAGSGWPAFSIFAAEGKPGDVFDAYFKAMGVKARTKEKIAGYSSWYNRYQNISEETILGDLKGTEGLLKEGDLFQIDDGWEPFVGDWLSSDPVKFPSGMKAAADRIHEAGYKAGLWLAPFVAERKSSVFREHPDWFLRVPEEEARSRDDNVSGAFFAHYAAAWRDYVLPEMEERSGAPWSCGTNWSGFYALDIDRPEVREYVKEVLRAVREDWGYDLVKLDFLYAAAPFGTEKETRAGRMFRAMGYLREWCGDMKILGCGVPLAPAFGTADYCRVSCDVTLSWDDNVVMQRVHRERPSTKHAIETDAARYSLDGRAFGNDPDVFFLRKENISLSAEEKLELARTCATCGSVFMTSDDMGKWDERARAHYRVLRNMFEESAK